MSLVKPGARDSLKLDRDDGKWVSSCLMALVNTKRIHQYVSLRGSPPKSKWLVPTPGARWAMGQPEGAFLADLLNFGDAPPTAAAAAPRHDAGLRPARPSRSDMARSFTLSLDVPATCSPCRAGFPPTCRWGGRSTSTT